MKSNHLMNQVEEDYERISDMDRMYLMERENELWEEYQEWCDEQDRLPAKVTITIESKRPISNFFPMN